MRVAAAAAALVGSLVLAGTATAAAPSGRASAPALVIRGHGFGHGVGLSQWGAEERARAGEDYRAILAFYYPGTQLATAPETNVRVLLARGPVATVGSTAPFSLTDGAGATLTLPAGRYRLTSAGTIAGRRLTFPLVATPGAQPLTLGRTPYAGTFTLAPVGARLLTVNTLPLETYLVGVVSSENPAGWLPQALRAQAVASRTYALANLRPQAPFDLYPDDRSQNYHGLERSYPGAAAAVAATAGEVLEYDGTLADTLFTAANGGLTSVPDGLWGPAGPAPYLVVRPDPFDARGPDSSWGPVVVPLARLRALFPQLPATVTSVTVSRNPGERVTAVDFTGSDGAVVSVPGVLFQHRLQLRSTYLALRLTR